MATYTRDQFVAKYSPYINTITQGTGLLTGTVLSQGILESSGNYNTGGQWLVGGSQLSQEANNYFGIKADPSWKGQVYNINTREVVGGKSIYEKDDFRKYDSVEDSIKDHLSFLQNNSRYRNAGVFDAKTVQEQADALKRAGYATAPDYNTQVSNIFNSIKGSISNELANVTVAAKITKEYIKAHWLPITLITTGVLIVIGLSAFLLINTKKTT